MADTRYTTPAGVAAAPNRVMGVPPARDGQIPIPLGYVNQLEGDKYMMFSGEGVTSKSEPILSNVFVHEKDFIPDSNNPNNGFLKLGGVSTDLASLFIQDGPPVVMMLEIKPKQKLGLIPEGVRIVGKDGTSSEVSEVDDAAPRARGNVNYYQYTNETDATENVIFYFPKATHGYQPRAAVVAGDIIQLERNIALISPQALGVVKKLSKQEVGADKQKLFVDEEMKKRFEVASKNVELMEEQLEDDKKLNSKDVLKAFSNDERNYIIKLIKTFRSIEEKEEKAKAKAKLKGKNASLDGNNAFDDMLKSGGFWDPKAVPSTMLASATGLPEDIKGDLAKKESGMAIGGDSTA